MHVIPILSFALCGCLLAPAPAGPSAPPAASAAVQAPQSRSASIEARVGQMFPPPRSGISLPAGEAGGVSLERLVAEFERATGMRLVVGGETRAQIARTPCGLQGPLEIPASEVYPLVEGLLAQSGFVLLPLHAREPRVAVLESLTGAARGTVRNSAWTVDESDTDLLVDHPAVLVQTVLDLNGIDARALSNAMRSLIVDQNVQQILPLGKADQLLLLGSGRQVAGWAAMLREAAQRERDRPEPPKKDEPEPAPK